MNAPLDLVRTRTAADVLRRIDATTLSSLVDHAERSPPDIAQRLQALDREWDIDRALELEAAVTGLLGLARRLGVRTAREIERERYAVKTLRGDFDDVPTRGSSNPEARARAALRGRSLITSSRRAASAPAGRP